MKVLHRFWLRVFGFDACPCGALIVAEAEHRCELPGLGRVCFACARRAREIQDDEQASHETVKRILRRMNGETPKWH